MLSVKQLPISKLPVDRNEPIIEAVPPDILHARTRIAEKHLRGLIVAAGIHQKNKLAPRLQALVRSAGVPFRITENLVHGKAQIGFNSLTGRHWKKLLPQLPELIWRSEDVFDGAHIEPLATVMRELAESLDFASKCLREDAARLAAITNKWLNSFLKLGEMGLQHFGRKDVTPYCHWLSVHIPFAVSIYGGLSKLSGELVENQNDQIKRTFLRRTCHKKVDQTLQMELRRELQRMLKDLDELREPSRAKKAGCLHPWHQISKLMTMIDSKECTYFFLIVAILLNYT